MEKVFEWKFPPLSNFCCLLLRNRLCWWLLSSAVVAWEPDVRSDFRSIQTICIHFWLILTCTVNVFVVGSFEMARTPKLNLKFVDLPTHTWNTEVHCVVYILSRDVSTGKFLGATSAMLDRICPPSWNRAKVSESLGVTTVLPVAPVVTSLIRAWVRNLKLWVPPVS